MPVMYGVATERAGLCEPVLVGSGLVGFPFFTPTILPNLRVMLREWVQRLPWKITIVEFDLCFRVLTNRKQKK